MLQNCYYLVHTKKSIFPPPVLLHPLPLALAYWQVVLQTIQPPVVGFRHAYKLYNICKRPAPEHLQQQMVSIPESFLEQLEAEKNNVDPGILSGCNPGHPKAWAPDGFVSTVKNASLYHLFIVCISMQCNPFRTYHFTIPEAP